MKQVEAILSVHLVIEVDGDPQDKLERFKKNCTVQVSSDTNIIETHLGEIELVSSTDID